MLPTFFRQHFSANIFEMLTTLFLPTVFCSHIKHFFYPTLPKCWQHFSSNIIKNAATFFPPNIFENVDNIFSQHFSSNVFKKCCQFFQNYWTRIYMEKMNPTLFTPTFLQVSSPIAVTGDDVGRAKQPPATRRPMTTQKARCTRESRRGARQEEWGCDCADRRGEVRRGGGTQRCRRGEPASP